MFVQLTSILGPAKATVGATVVTPLGTGVLKKYSSPSDSYTVDLGEFWACVVFLSSRHTIVLTMLSKSW